MLPSHDVRTSDAHWEKTNGSFSAILSAPRKSGEAASLVGRIGADMYLWHSAFYMRASPSRKKLLALSLYRKWEHAPDEVLYTVGACILRQVE